MKSFLLLLSLVFTFSLCGQRIKNVRYETQGELMYIYYDLEGCAETEKEVEMEVSYLLKERTEQGKLNERTGTVATALGDINKYVSCGKGKTIIWEYNKDILNKNYTEMELYPYIKQKTPEQVEIPIKTGAGDKDFGNIHDFIGRYLPPQKSVYVLSVGINSPNSPDVLAENDAKTFAKYAEINLSIAQENVMLLLNPDSATFSQNLKRLSLLAKAMKGKGSFILYFSGNKLVEGDKMYLLLADGGYELQGIYAQLALYPTRQTTVMLETDFSETTEKMLVPDKKKVSENLAVICAASPGEANLPVAVTGHHLFTYALLNAIRTTYKEVAYKEVLGKTKEFVEKKAASLAESSQKPVVYSAAKTGNAWRGWNFLE